jgi:hypothetical protein
MGVSHAKPFQCVHARRGFDQLAAWTKHVSGGSGSRPTEPPAERRPVRPAGDPLPAEAIRGQPPPRAQGRPGRGGLSAPAPCRWRRWRSTAAVGILAPRRSGILPSPHRRSTAGDLPDTMVTNAPAQRCDTALTKGHVARALPIGREVQRLPQSNDPSRQRLAPEVTAVPARTRRQNMQADPADNRARGNHEGCVGVVGPARTSVSRRRRLNRRHWRWLRRRCVSTEPRW